METVKQSAKKPLFSVRQLSYIAMAAALIAVCSWISIPVGEVPVTLQTFGICLVTGLLGLQCGLAAVCVYLILGLVGVPVFAGFTSGVGILLGTTGGFLIGFLLTAVIVGLFVHFFGRRVWALAVGMVLGIAACYAFGTVWFLAVYTSANGAVALGTVLGWCVLPFLLPDACKIVLAILLVNRLGKVIKL